MTALGAIRGSWYRQARRCQAPWLRSPECAILSRYSGSNLAEASKRELGLAAVQFTVPTPSHKFRLCLRTVSRWSWFAGVRCTPHSQYASPTDFFSILNLTRRRLVLSATMDLSMYFS